MTVFILKVKVKHIFKLIPGKVWAEFGPDDYFKMLKLEIGLLLSLGLGSKDTNLSFYHDIFDIYSDSNTFHNIIEFSATLY